jgi:UDP-N-acetylmuramate dehydrogenase
MIDQHIKMNFHRNFSLKAHNTFGIDATAAFFAEIQSVAGLREALKETARSIFILGAGSNLLLTGDLDHLVLHNAIQGREVMEKMEEHVIVAAGGGENWHEFVLWCLDNGFGGLENLSLIPGTVGAAPIQNIGAYGVELKDVFHHLEAVERATGNLQVFHPDDCRFGYRNSIFKNELKDRYFITRVFFRLSSDRHQLHTSYGAIGETLLEMGISHPTIRDISNAVIRIRSSKLPDPAKLGNSGSFFKNPEISRQDFKVLKERFPYVVSYPAGGDLIKIPAGWLIEQCGWKGKRKGNVGCYEKQALVIVNYGGATGQEVWNFAQNVADSVEEKFGIRLEAEVNVVMG